MPILSYADLPTFVPLRPSYVARSARSNEFECDGKKAYRSRKAAQRTKRLRDQPGIHVYECNNCHLWHLGHRYL